MSAEDRRLISRASRGDVVAFSRLVEDYSDLVRGVAARVVGQREAEDAAQEVWIRVWANMKSFRAESSFGTWLYRISTNTCLSLRQKEARREERERGNEATSYLPEPQGDDADPEAAALGAERREEIRGALGHVREDHRKALVLRHMEGLSYAEIADTLTVPAGTAKGWVSRGRDAMLVALVKEGTEGEVVAQGAVS